MRILYNIHFFSMNIKEKAGSLDIRFEGKSVDREPGTFIVPILDYILKYCKEKKLRLVLDFRKLTSMNSSSIAPIVKFLRSASQDSILTTLRYDKTQDWQRLMFSALKIFKDEDNGADA